jgi:hypothetical protein
MEWTFKDKSQSTEKQPSTTHNRAEPKESRWNYSERVPPPPMMSTTIDDEELQSYRDTDLVRGLQDTMIWGTGQKTFVKIWDKHTHQVNTNMFGQDQAAHGHIQTIARQYLRRYPSAVHENIWWDQQLQKLFSNAQTYCSGLDPIEHSFCTTADRFVNQTWTSIASEMGRMIEDMTVCYNSLGQRPNAKGVTAADINEGRCYGDLVFPDLRIGVCPAITNMTNQDSVLIIGGGPSAKNIDYSAYKDIPVWSMNNYYLNPLFDQFSNIQAACFLDEVDIFNNDKLWEYVNDRDTIVFQEITDFGPERLNYVKNTAHYSTYFHTRYRSKLGVGARMLVTAILLGIKNIYFCGFDGYDASSTDNHSFESGKDLPGWLKKTGPHVQDQQYVMFWDYILNSLKFSRAFKIIDISAGQPTLQYNFLAECDLIR